MHHARGTVTRQAHVDLPEGTVEEELGRNGFFGKASHLYRRHPPVGWSAVEGEIRPRAIVATELPGLGSHREWPKARIAFLENDDVVLHMARLAEPMKNVFRNADADEILFVHGGAGTCRTDFGPLAYERGDYLVLPRGVGYRLFPSAPSQFLIVESMDEVKVPERGLLGRHALFDEDVMVAPTPETEPTAEMAVDAGRTSWRVDVQRRGTLSHIDYPFDPFDVVGWKGDLYPYRLATRDIRPIMSERYHLPPSAHATFVMPNVVVCTFLPRGLETGDPGALKVPFYHSNIDYDEVLFYHDGDFFSRAGMKAGMVTFHPQGIHHGPQPAAVRAAVTKERTNEQAVMIDTRRPLSMTEAANRAQIPDYHMSWSEKKER
jgi:homogentisate 1,2-dioxygenase